MLVEKEIALDTCFLVSPSLIPVHKAALVTLLLTSLSKKSYSFGKENQSWSNRMKLFQGQNGTLVLKDQAHPNTCSEFFCSLRIGLNQILLDLREWGGLRLVTTLIVREYFTQLPGCSTTDTCNSVTAVLCECSETWPKKSRLSWRPRRLVDSTQEHLEVS